VGGGVQIDFIPESSQGAGCAANQLHLVFVAIDVQIDFNPEDRCVQDLLFGKKHI